MYSKVILSEQKPVQSPWSSSSVCMMNTIPLSYSSLLASQCSAVNFLYEIWNVCHLVLWGGGFFQDWMKKRGEEAEKIMCKNVLVQLHMVIWNHTACYSTGHPAKIRWDLKKKKKKPQNSRTKNLHSQPLEKPLVGFLGFQKWETISADQVERKNVLSMKTMKRSSSPHIRFSSSHPVIMPASFSMPSTGTAAFPGKDNFSTNVPLHS